MQKLGNELGRPHARAVKQERVEIAPLQPFAPGAVHHLQRFDRALIRLYRAFFGQPQAAKFGARRAVEFDGEGARTLHPAIQRVF